MVYRYASKVIKVSVSQLLGDAANLSRGLMTARDLFDYDGIMSNYDTYADVDTLGESLGWAQGICTRDLIAMGRAGGICMRGATSLDKVGQRQVILEATQQICEAVGREIPVMGVVSSPMTAIRTVLAERCQPFCRHREELSKYLSDVQAVVLDSIKTYCEDRVDAIWLVEEDWTDIMREDIDCIKPLYETMWNVAQYYDVKTVLAFHRYDIDDIEKYLALGSDAVFFGGEASGGLQIDALAEKAATENVCLGIGCPYPVDPEDELLLDRTIEAIRRNGNTVFLSTRFEVDLDVLPEHLNAIVNRIKS
jgi:hypothetical protein